MQYFQLAKRYNHASRLARAHGLTGELSSLALQAANPNPNPNPNPNLNPNLTLLLEPCS